jgi:hypothetical protein
MDERTTRQVKVLEGMHFSFRLLEYHSESMYGSCSAIPKDRAQIIPALAHCWGFIDALHRLRELAQVVPGLKGQYPERRRFIAETKLVEGYRHYIQHLKREVGQRKIVSTQPVWGSLSWVDPEDASATHTVQLGSKVVETTYTGAVYDTVEKRWVSRVCLSVGGSSFNFDVLFREVTTFAAFMKSWMAAHGDGAAMSDDLPIFTVHFIPIDGTR